MKTPTLRKRTTETTPEALAGIRAWIERIFGLRSVDLDRLDDDQQARLAELVKQARTEANGIDLTQQGRGERRSLEKLVEKAADRPGHFEQARENVKLRRELGALAERAARPPRRPRLEQEGAVVLPALVFEDLAAKRLTAVDVTHLALVDAYLSGGLKLPRGKLDRDGALVFDAHMVGLASPWDPEGDLSGVPYSLDWLRESGWLDVRRSGREVRISRGERWRTALDARERSR